MNVLDRLVHQFYKWWMRDSGYTYSYRVNKEMDVLKNIISFEKSDKLLDLACGKGEFTLKFAEMCDGVVGIDKDFSQLNELKKRIKRKKIDNLFIICADLTEYNFEELGIIPHFFSKIYIGVLFQYLSDEEMKRILIGMKQVLEEGAMVIVKESTAPKTVIASDGDIRRSFFDIVNLFTECGYSLKYWKATEYFEYQKFFIFEKG